MVLGVIFPRFKFTKVNSFRGDITPPHLDNACRYQKKNVRILQGRRGIANAAILEKLISGCSAPAGVLGAIAVGCATTTIWDRTSFQWTQQHNPRETNANLDLNNVTKNRQLGVHQYEMLELSLSFFPVMFCLKP